MRPDPCSSRARCRFPAHVVADEGQVLATQALAREAQVTARAGQRLARVKALVHPTAPCLEAPDPARVPAAGGPGDGPRETRALPDVDLHVEQSGTRARQDLR